MTADPEGKPRRQPLVFDVGEDALPPVPPPAEAPDPDDSGAEPAGARALRAAASPRGRMGSAGRALIGVLLSLAGLWLSVAVWDFAASLFARSAVLGWAGTVLVAAFFVLSGALILREAAALARLRRIETLGVLAADARRGADAALADRAIDGLARLYAARPELASARAGMLAARADTPDAAARLDIAERLCLSPLDARASVVVEAASRDVAAATALLPLPAADIASALYINLRMIRRIAEVYGGRAGWLGSWRLMRAVAVHLVATGAVAVTDDMIGPAIGGGLLGSVSRRFGEGALNGALTARVGVAAMEVCRPMPFAALPRPSASGVLVRALRGWRDGSGRNRS